jgi:hypothetical protein
MTTWAGRRLGKYERLKLLAQEQNRIKDDIHHKFTSRAPGDRVLSKEEFRTMGFAWAAAQKGKRWSRLLRLGR